MTNDTPPLPRFDKRQAASERAKAMWAKRRAAKAALMPDPAAPPIQPSPAPVMLPPAPPPEPARAIVSTGRRLIGREPVATVFVSKGRRQVATRRSVVTTMANPRQGPRPGSFRGGG